MEETSEGPRNAALDGLRALAVSAVLLFHGGVSWLPGGFLGVDLFFVLSGFLITGLLLAEHKQSGRIRLGAFWARRARRLLPALFVMVLVVVAVAGIAGADGVAPGLRGDALSTLGYVANWRLVLEGSGYFAQQADPSALQHTWSLAIEEQFYLLWPLMLLLALRLGRGSRRLFVAVTSVGLVASAAGTAVASVAAASTSSLYYRTDTRAQALLLGALIAAVLPTSQVGSRRRSALTTVLAVTGLLGSALLWTSAHGDSSWLYRGGLLAAAAAAGALVCAAAIGPQTLVGRTLGLLPLRALGRISYGVYLWHWPLDLALTHDRTGLSGPSLLAVRLVATLAAATLSWFLVEQPLRRVTRIVPTVVLPISLAAGLATAFGVLAFTAVAPSQSAVPAASNEVDDVLPFVTLTSTPEAVATTPPAAPATLPPVPSGAPHPTGSPSHRYTGPIIPVTVLGDSVADSLGSGLAPVDEHEGTRVSNRGIVGCGIAATPRYRFRGTTYAIADVCRDWERTWAADIRRDHPRIALVVVGRHEVWDGELDGHWTHVGNADFDAYLAGQLDRAIAIASAGGARVAMATTPYFQGREAPDGSRYPENDPRRVDRFNSLLRAAVARHSGQAFLVDLGRKSCPDGHYTSTVDGIRIRKDGVHFSAAGARWLAPWLLPQLVAAAR